MSLATLFGLDKVGEQSVEQAHATVNDALVKAEPILQRFANLVGGILHGLLDRVECDFHFVFKIHPIERAVAANEDKANQ